jgi:hypothetical protein
MLKLSMRAMLRNEVVEDGGSCNVYERSLGAHQPELHEFSLTPAKALNSVRKLHSELGNHLGISIRCDSRIFVEF